jgi:hypothetical protein
MPVKLAVPLPGPFVWMRRTGDSPVGCLGVLAIVFGLPLILFALALAGVVVLLYVVGQVLLIGFDELVVMVDDWDKR